MRDNKIESNYHPGIEPGIDFIWGSDQDQYAETTTDSESIVEEENNQIEEQL